jgi:hypothetical protein
MRTIRITATGENRFHNIVSTVSRVSGNGDGAGLNHPRPGGDRGFNCADDADDTDANIRSCRQLPPTSVAARLPALEAQPCGLVCEVPGHDHVPQAPDPAIIQDGLGALPRRQLWKVEIDDGGPRAFTRRFEDHLRAREIGGEGLLQEDRLPNFEVSVIVSPNLL